MADELQAAVPGHVIYSSDLNQLVYGVSAEADIGSLSFLTPLSPTAAPSLAPGAAGNPNGTYYGLVVLATGLAYDNGVLVVRGFTQAGAAAPVTVASQEIDWSSIPTGGTGTIARALYRSLTIANPATALSLSLVADTASTLAATTYYVDYALGNANGTTTPGASEASVAIATANADDIQFSVTLPATATYALVGIGTASGGEAQYAQVSATGAVTYVGTNSAGVSATVSGSTLTITIKAPPSDTSHAMPSTNTANLANYQFCGWLGDNTTTTFTDNVADASLGTGMPTASSSPPVIGQAIPSTAPSVNTTGSGFDAVRVTGLSGTSGPVRLAGAVSGAAPTTGSWLANDVVVDTANHTFWLATATGTPGTWAKMGGTVPSFAYNSLNNYSNTSVSDLSTQFGIIVTAGSLGEVLIDGVLTLTNGTAGDTCVVSIYRGSSIPAQGTAPPSGDSLLWSGDITIPVANGQLTAGARYKDSNLVPGTSYAYYVTIHGTGSPTLVGDGSGAGYKQTTLTAWVF